MSKKNYILFILFFVFANLFAQTKLDSLFKSLKHSPKKAEILTSIADEYSIMNKLELAEEYYDRASEAALKEKKYSLLLYTIYIKYQLDIQQYYLTNDIIVEDYKKSINLIQKSDSLIAIYNYYVASLYNSIGNSNKALSYALKSMEYFSRNKKSKRSYYKVVYLLSDIYLQMNQTNKAISLLLKNIDLTKSEKDYKYYVQTINHLTNLYMEKQIYDKALELFYELLSNKNCKLSDFDKANIYLNIGEIFYSNNSANAVNYILKAITYFKKNHNDSNGLINAYNTLATIYSDGKQYEKALKYYKKALNIAENTNDLYFKAIIYNNIGEVYRSTKEFNKALAYYNQSFNLYKDQFNDEDLLAVLFLNLSLVDFEQKNYKKALSELNKIKDLKIQFVDKSTIKDIYKQYSKIYEKLKNYKKSLYYLKKYLKLKKEINSKEKQKNINNLQLKIETQQIEESIKLLKKNKKIKELKLKQVKLRNKLYTIIGIIFLMTSLFLAYSFYQSQKANKKINKMNQELDRLSRKDPLTKLSNRRDITEKINYEIARAKRHNTPLSLLMIDIDHFKKINDNYGHDAGDFVLVTLAEILKKTLREQDLISRWGGEEFLIALPETSMDNAFLVAEKLRKKVEESLVNFNGNQIKITITIGVAEYKIGKTLSEVVKKADMALYQGKSKGRNRTIIFLNNS